MPDLPKMISRLRFQMDHTDPGALSTRDRGQWARPTVLLLPAYPNQS